MLRIVSTARACVLITAALVSSTASPARAQYHRFELTPFGSYQWGGSFDTDALAVIPAGKLSENSSFSWGGVLSFLMENKGAVDLFYLRQDTDVDFASGLTGKKTVGDFANNYIQLGVRQGLPGERALSPFLSASMGINVLDPKESDIGSSTRFSWSLGGGAIFMPEGGRVGLRMDIRWMVTPVPSGTYSTWCNAWGCYTGSGSAWLHQGQAGAGLVFAF